MKPARIHSTRQAPDPPQSFRVTRQSRFGNPWTVDDAAGETREVVVDRFKRWLFDPMSGEWSFDPVRKGKLIAGLPELIGKNLGCACPLDGRPCHAQVLLDLVNDPGALAAIQRQP